MGFWKKDREVLTIRKQRYCQKFYENQGMTHENDDSEQRRREGKEVVP